MIRITQASLYVAAVPHPGLAGRSNEDRYAVSSYRVSGTDPTPSIFAILSDGIGGHQAGEVAAEMAVETLTLPVDLVRWETANPTLRDEIARWGKVLHET